MDAGEATYERLAYDAAQRALDKQERLLEELRSRTGLLLAAASLAASFLGREAFAEDPKRGLALVAVRVELQKLFTAFRVAAGGLAAEILVLIAMVSDTLF